MATYAEKLAAVEAAIEKVLLGQSYTMGGRTLTRANLSELQEREKYLTTMAARESGGGLRLSRGEFSGGDR